ncbi:MAG: polysaccharide deacetylase family protein, partial [Armatimonadetes bacterium]|nr:polysaccharide deacetylase family protein [Armatimonadota bacterium]
IQVLVANRNRTADADQSREDERLGLLLAELCLPVARAEDFHVLTGMAAAGVGLWREALDALESGFARWPWSRPLRAALLRAYETMGLAQAPREIHVLPAPGEVAITFDDGPHPRVTPYLLRVLAQREVRATFFLVGKQALVYPDLVRSIIAQGHEVGSHSFTHANMDRLSELDVMRELAESRWAIRQACGRNVVLFRPPGGHYSSAVRDACGRMGFRPVFWEANICRYAGRPRNEIIAGLLQDLAKGGILLLHSGEDETPQIVEELIDHLQASGFKLGPVGELCGIPEPYLTADAPQRVRAGS